MRRAEATPSSFSPARTRQIGIAEREASASIVRASPALTYEDNSPSPRSPCNLCGVWFSSSRHRRRQCISGSKREGGSLDERNRCRLITAIVAAFKRVKEIGWIERVACANGLWSWSAAELEEKRSLVVRSAQLCKRLPQTVRLGRIPPSSYPSLVQLLGPSLMLRSKYCRRAQL